MCFPASRSGPEDESHSGITLGSAHALRGHPERDPNGIQRTERLGGVSFRGYELLGCASVLCLEQTELHCRFGRRLKDRLRRWFRLERATE